MKIRVVDYDNRWEAQYKQEAQVIRDILGDLLVDIHHIGSTFVYGLQAKPIIDIMPVVRDIKAVDHRNLAFEQIGYECMGEYGIPGRRYLRKGSVERTHHVHIFEERNTHDIQRHLVVRDYLRAHAEVAFEYGKLKKALALQYPHDMDAYCDGKDNFVKQLESAAQAWAQQ